MDSSKAKCGWFSGGQMVTLCFTTDAHVIYYQNVYVSSDKVTAPQITNVIQFQGRKY